MILFLFVANYTCLRTISADRRDKRMMSTLEAKMCKAESGPNQMPCLLD
jgi:hypothetical protein